MNFGIRGIESVGQGLKNMKQEQVFIDGTIHLLRPMSLKTLKSQGLLNILDDERIVWFGAKQSPRSVGDAGYHRQRICMRDFRTAVW